MLFASKVSVVPSDRIIVLFIHSACLVNEVGMVAAEDAVFEGPANPALELPEVVFNPITKLVEEKVTPLRSKLTDAVTLHIPAGNEIEVASKYVAEVVPLVSAVIRDFLTSPT